MENSMNQENRLTTYKYNRDKSINRYWVKHMYTAAFRLGVVPKDDNHKLSFDFDGELQDNSSAIHNSFNEKHYGTLTVNGKKFSNVIAIIHKGKLLTTFWPNTQHADGYKSCTDELVNLYMYEDKNNITPDENYTFEKVASHYHKIFKDNPSAPPAYIMKELYKDSAKFDKHSIDDTLKSLEMSNKDLENKAAEQKHTIHNQAKALNNMSTKNTQQKDEIEKLKLAASMAYDGRGNGGLLNDGVYTLMDVKWGSRGVRRAVIVRLKDKDNQEFEVANNWLSGLEHRFSHATMLVGKQVKYSTWGNYSRDWFMNIFSPDYNT